MKPSVHEAGHAVIARVLGFPVVWVSVGQLFIDKDLDRLLDIHWATVMRVAVALYERCTPMADDVDAVIWANDMMDAA